jgi:tetratricopeptide (TPR) repeat protein
MSEDIERAGNPGSREESSREISGMVWTKKAIDKNPRYAEAYFHSGCSYSRLGRYQEAVNAYSKAIAINPGYFEAHNSRCWTYGKLSRWTEAVGICRQALAMRPSPEAFNNLGGAYGMLGL